MTSRVLGTIAAVLLLLAVPDQGRAQGYPFSQRGATVQNVAHTRIEVAYGRPVARGRELFGALVPWDAVWHPGADSATVISLDHDLVVEGQPLPAGDYSLWLIPRERGPWTLIFSRAAHVFHQPFPGDSTAALRLEIQPATASHMESMAIYFSMVLREDAELRIHWGERVLPVRISAPWKPPASDSGSLQEGH